ncbi:DUF6712 family protein [Allomuricauda sp. ARW1Y1]|jgi:hypothetical protein|uniref:DUF6712 family protein n=1 Tax=Allomuricauda sp. ARW1Y1 TaxID=2663843 RepID=UPI0015C89A02|nr:DUF6712 family protein [Muricauda sp. ARW1Y1]NYJ27510.1 hypothetical protein [Muricauda sp. ARW1Y1]
MKLLFNREVNSEKQGQKEIKETLGFLSADMSFTNLESDIILCTPDLIDLIGTEVYDKMADFYNGEDNPPTENAEVERHNKAVKYAQIYILSMAYLDYASDNDLNHGNDGRTVRTEEDQDKPFEWQVNKSNSSIKKRGYKALDQLMLLLDSSGWTEWTGSDQYKQANSIFIKNTKEFDTVFPINKSGQLYYRLVPFMADIESDKVSPILGKDVFESLKTEESPDAGQKELQRLVKKAVAHLSLGKALKAFPVEMFPDGIVYSENTRMKSEARAEVMQFMNKEGNDYLIKLEHVFSQQNQTFEQINLTQGLSEGSKHVSL